MVVGQRTVSLADLWSEEFLGAYEGSWIAFQDGVVMDSDQSLEKLSRKYKEQIREGIGPVFAFVTFGIRA